jgi:adenine-specific DNA-methyltransferase
LVFQKKIFQINNDDTIPQIMIKDILQFSIPNLLNETSLKIENFVNQTLLIKSENPKADTQNPEQQIDTMVYELYDLTEEEIKIVEGN